MKTCKTCGLTLHSDDFYKNRRGIHAHCKKCYIERNAAYQQKYRDGNRIPIRVRSCRARAKLKGLAFDLTAEHLESIWTGICPAFGVPLDIDAKKGELGHAELDRISPEKGYTQGNVVWLSQRANRIKDDATIEDLERLLTWLKSL